MREAPTIIRLAARGLEKPQAAEEIAEVARGGGQVDLVPFLQHKGTAGDRDLAPARNRAESAVFRVHVAVQIGQRHARQRVAGAKAVFNEFQSGPRQNGSSLIGAGETQQRGRFSRAVAFSGLMTMDRPSSARMKRSWPLVFRVADCGRWCGRVPIFLATRQARMLILVAGGGGDQQIGAVLERFALNVVARARCPPRRARRRRSRCPSVSSASLSIGDDVMAFGGQLLGQGAGPTLPRPHGFTICIGYTLLWGGAKGRPGSCVFTKKPSGVIRFAAGTLQASGTLGLLLAVSGAPWLPTPL